MLSNLVRITVLVGLSLYGLGLLTVNGHLLSAGVADFSIVRPKFILAGLLLLSFIILAVGVVLWGLVHLFTAREGRTRTKFEKDFLPGSMRLKRATEVDVADLIHVAGGLILSLFLCTSWLKILAVSNLSYLEVLGKYIIVPWILIVATSFLVLAFGNYTLQLWKQDIASKIYSFTYLVIVCTTVVGITRVFSVYIYPAIPHQYGGGRARAIQLSLSEDRGSGDYLIHPCVELVHETEEYLLIRAGANVYQISREEVLAFKLLVESPSKLYEQALDECPEAQAKDTGSATE